jgi:hypothetical protein
MLLLLLVSWRGEDRSAEERREAEAEDREFSGLNYTQI